jgi:hypothetical protein
VCQIERRGGAEMKIRKCVRGLSEVVNNVITVCVCLGFEIQSFSIYSDIQQLLVEPQEG